MAEAAPARRLAERGGSYVHLLIGALPDSRADAGRLDIDPNNTPAVMRLLRLVHLDRFILGDTDS